MKDIQNAVIETLDNSGKKDALIEKDLHLPRSTVYDWRNGRSESYKKYIPEIAEYFGVSADYLLGIGQKNKATTRHSDLINEALSIMNGLPKDRQDNAIALLRAMAALSDKTENK